MFPPTSVCEDLETVNLPMECSHMRRTLALLVPCVDDAACVVQNEAEYINMAALTGLVERGTTHMAHLIGVCSSLGNRQVIAFVPNYVKFSCEIFKK